MVIQPLAAQSHHSSLSSQVGSGSIITENKTQNIQLLSPPLVQKGAQNLTLTVPSGKYNYNPDGDNMETASEDESVNQE